MICLLKEVRHYDEFCKKNHFQISSVIKVVLRSSKCSTWWVCSGKKKLTTSGTCLLKTKTVQYSHETLQLRAEHDVGVALHFRPLLRLWCLLLHVTPSIGNLTSDHDKSKHAKFTFDDLCKTNLQSNIQVPKAISSCLLLQQNLQKRNLSIKGWQI